MLLNLGRIGTHEMCAARQHSAPFFGFVRQSILSALQPFRRSRDGDRMVSNRMTTLLLLRQMPKDGNRKSGAGIHGQVTPLSQLGAPTRGFTLVSSDRAQPRHRRMPRRQALEKDLIAPIVLGIARHLQC
jgi:hypothetical protein